MKHLLKKLLFTFIFTLLIGIGTITSAFAADRYWVGGTGNWDASTTTHWSATSGGAGGASVPALITDNVIFDSASSASAYTVTLTASSNALDLTIGNPASGALTIAGIFSLNIRGSLYIATGVLRTFTGNINFPAITTGKTITTNGLVLASPINFSGIGGGWTITDSLNNGISTISWSVSTNSMVFANGAVITCGTWTNGSGCGSLTMNSATLNIATTPWSAINLVTFNAGTGTIALTGAAAVSFNGSSKTYYNLSLSPTAAPTVAVAVTNLTSVGGNFTYTPSGTNTTLNDKITFASAITIGGNLNINGFNSGLKRCLLASTVVGTPLSITVNGTVSVVNTDLQDIAAAGTATWNLSAATGGSGDCGGNTGITFTTGSNKYWKGNTGLVSSATQWFTATNGGGSLTTPPLPQDTGFFDANSITLASQTITFNMPRVGSIDFTGLSTTFTLASSILSGELWRFFGSITHLDYITMSGTQAMYLVGRGSGNTLTGVSVARNLFIDCITGTYSSIGNFGVSGAFAFTLTSGTFDASLTGILDVTKFVSSNTNVRNIIMGPGTWYLEGNAQTIWDTGTATNLTIDPGTALVLPAYSGASGARTFIGGTNPAARINRLAISGASDTFSITSVMTKTFDVISYSGILGGAGPINCSGSFQIGLGTTRAYTGTITMSSTTTGNTFKTSGRQFAGPIIFDGVGGDWTLSDALTNTGATTLVNGTLSTADWGLNLGSFVSTSGSARTLNLGASVVSMTGVGTVWSATSPGFTLNPGTSSINLTSNSASNKQFDGGGLTYNNFWNNTLSTGTVTITGNNTFNDLKVDAGRTQLFSGGSIQTLTTLTATGISGSLVTLKSATSRVRFYLLNASATITNNWMSLTDSAVIGGATWNAGANTTFVSNNVGWANNPTMVRYWVPGGTGAWSSTTNWSLTNGGTSGASIPIGEDVYFTSSSGSGTSNIDVATTVGSIDTTGFTGSLSGFSTMNIYGNLTIASSVSYSYAGSMTYQFGYNTSRTITTTQTLAGPIIFSMQSDVVTLQSNFSTSSTSALNSGTVNLNGYAVSSSSTFTATGGSITFGASTWSFSGTGNLWNVSGAFAITPGTGTITFSDSSSTAKSFIGNGLTYNNFTTTGDNVTITGSNTFNTIVVSNAGLTNGLKFTNGTNTTVSNITSNGSAGSLARISSNSSGSAATITKLSGTISLDYMSIKDSIATGGATFYAGSHSTDVSGNTGWIFSAFGGSGGPTTIKHAVLETFSNLKTVGGGLKTGIKSIVGQL
jgi:hypothetical protein